MDLIDYPSLPTATPRAAWKNSVKDTTSDNGVMSGTLWDFQCTFGHVWMTMTISLKVFMFSKS